MSISLAENSQFSKQAQPENRSDAEDITVENPLVQEKIVDGSSSAVHPISSKVGFVEKQ